jgi:hypothetical protein
MDSSRERSRSVPTAGVRSELRLLPRAGIWRAGEPLYAGDPTPLQGGVHNLSPNSISQAAIFVAVCEGYLGIAPHWDLWTHLFFAELFASPTGERKVRAAVRAGGCTLLLRQSRASLYIHAILASSNKGWQRRWFYLRNDGELLPPFSQRVVTVTADAWHHGTPHERQKNLEPLLKALEVLRKRGTHRRGSDCRHPPPEGASLGGASVAALGDDTGGRLGGLADVLGPSSLRCPPWAGGRRVGETGPQRLLSAFDAPRPRVRDFGECPLLSSSCIGLLLVLTVGIFLLLQEVGWHKPSLPRVPQDAVDRAARRVAAEEKKKKKDAEKARAHERMRARHALEKLHRRQEREGLPREPSPETPDDDDDDEDDDEEDDMAARLGLSLGLGLGQEPSSQPLSGLMPPIPGVGTAGSRPEERGQSERVLDPSAGGVEAPPGSQAEASAPREPPPTPAAHESNPQVAVAVPGQFAPGRSGRPKQGWCQSCRRSGPRRRLRGSRSERPPPRHG